MAQTRKPIKHGADYVRGTNWKRRQYTRAGAEQYAKRAAKRSRMYGAVGAVSDCGGYWRVNVAAQWHPTI